MRKSFGVIVGLGILAYSSQKEGATTESRPKVEMRPLHNKAPEKVAAEGVEQRAQERRVESVAAALKEKIRNASDLQEELDVSGDCIYQNREQAWTVAYGIQKLIGDYVGPGEVTIIDVDGDDIPEIFYNEGPLTHKITLDGPKPDDASSEWTLYVETQDSGSERTHSGRIRLQTGVPSETTSSSFTAYFNGELRFDQD